VADAANEWNMADNERKRQRRRGGEELLKISKGFLAPFLYLICG
jgi:hypothetical protein